MKNKYINFINISSVYLYVYLLYFKNKYKEFLVIIIMADEITSKNVLDGLGKFGLSSNLYCGCAYSFEEPYKLTIEDDGVNSTYTNVKENSLLELIRSALANDTGRLERKVKFFKHNGQRVDEGWEDYDPFGNLVGLGIATLQAKLRLTQTQKGLVIASFDYSLKDEDFPDSDKFLPYGYEKGGKPNKLIQDLIELSRRLEEKLKNES